MQQQSGPAAIAIIERYIWHAGIMIKKSTRCIIKSTYLLLTFLLIIMGVSASVSSVVSPNETAIACMSGRSFFPSRVQEDQASRKQNQVPEKSIPVSGEEDQRENSNEKEWSDSEYFYANNYSGLAFIHRSGLSMSLLNKVFSNRKTISLYILYHTWKSYLS
ncbi:hypothetical protein [Cyclobacterium jeungdonense]|uniref:Uncharacterized protein n=1 Tax=Cyclobacterium jeungdonense TaxID=708087 RepID=A0ABT8C6Z6_9BACT|nr:hypothetical protein [Cyclobacterium jeungdonense]MDN3687573.1 hypothetical protein [Cyclobacterium jeungdonense]